MSLPPALLARLQKRGIIKEPENNDVQPPNTDGEEVFAESYDEPQINDVPGDSAPSTTNYPPPEHTEDDIIEGTLIREVIACPNKSNPYHECVDFCRLHWGMKEFEPDPINLRRRSRMLRKHPLPNHWKEVADPETCRYYYWNTHTDEVSWLSPAHPNADISLSADTIQALKKVNESQLDEEGIDIHYSSAESDESSSEEESDNERRHQKSRILHSKDRRRAKDELDPMDPSSYSDVPRGSWTSGLDQRGSAKTGVDETVAGPLFQQRPYPSPGDVLRANRKVELN